MPKTNPMTINNQTLIIINLIPSKKQGVYQPPDEPYDSN
jgi:hypothetical protein